MLTVTTTTMTMMLMNTSIIFHVFQVLVELCMRQPVDHRGRPIINPWASVAFRWAVL
jgi:hypothetical protein